MAINKGGTYPNLKSVDTLERKGGGGVSAKISPQVKALSFEVQRLQSVEILFPF